MRTTFLPFHRPDIGEEEISAVADTLRSGWISTGPLVRRFEEAFGRRIGAAHAIAVNSCTAALHLALEALGVGAGDEVVVPTMTFAASAEVVAYLGATPVLVDCKADTLNIDVDRLERALTPRTKAIMPVHVAGLPCDMDALCEIARHHGIPVVEDAAHAFPAAYRGRQIGTTADISAFSFYATKTLTTGEGGMVTTANPAWADRMRLMSLHGISKNAWKRYAADGSWRYEIEEAGFKYNLTDIAASIGLVQLAKSDRMLEARCRIAQRYDAGLREVPDIQLPSRDSHTQHAWHLYIIKLDLPRLRFDRGEFIERLRQRQIGSSVHFIPLHLHPYYQRRLGPAAAEQCPTATDVCARLVSLPIYPSMTESDVDEVVEAVEAVIGEGRR